MFRLLGTIKGLGFRNERVKYDIEFPTRNHLKVFLSKLIKKRRHQQEKGIYDLNVQQSTAIISSTDNCEEEIVSHLCKNMFTPRENEDNLMNSPRGGAATSIQSPRRFMTNRGSSISTLNTRKTSHLGLPGKKQD